MIRILTISLAAAGARAGFASRRWESGFRRFSTSFAIP